MSTTTHAEKTVSQTAAETLKRLGIKPVNSGATTGSSMGVIQTQGTDLQSLSPIDSSLIASVVQAQHENYEQVMKKAEKAFLKWRMMPSPERGQIVREIGNALRTHKQDLGTLISLEMGKIIQEGLGEIQEMIDIADFSVGLSRQLYGLTMHSERPDHRMYEQWHPLGIVGVITSFNFPAAVWSWNALIAAVCGDVIVWKPSSKTPLTALAIQNVIAPIVDKYDIDGVFNLIIGKGRDIGETLIHDSRIPLVSVTGSCSVGRHVGSVTGKRLARSILELGGNNAVIIDENADLNNAIKATFFSAIGTAGQRCTSTRRILVHNSLKQEYINKMIHAYRQINIGSPLDEHSMMGPLSDPSAVNDMMKALEQVKKEGGKILYGGKTIHPKGLENGSYVIPAIVEVENHFNIVQEETFAPILYIIGYDHFDDALKLHNEVPQGLSSAIFTDSVKRSEQFLSHKGSDCGIANVNTSTTGAEIGGAFGGEKDTGGGRESGSDAWKAYMRRQTVTVNWGNDISLAQGIQFNLGD